MIRSITDPSQKWRPKFKGATSRNFESFSATCKITFNVRETAKYQFGNIEKHQNGKNEPNVFNDTNVFKMRFLEKLKE